MIALGIDPASGVSGTNGVALVSWASGDPRPRLLYCCAVKGLGWWDRGERERVLLEAASCLTDKGAAVVFCEDQWIPRGSTPGAASQAAAAVGTRSAAVAWCYTAAVHGWPVDGDLVTPAEWRSAIGTEGGRRKARSAAKAAAVARVRATVRGLPEALESLPKYKQEAICEAVGVALAGIKRMKGRR